MQHSDDDVTYADAAAADIQGGTPTQVVDATTEDETVYKFGYVGNKRYVKAVATPTGVHTNGTPIGIVAVRGHAALSPVA